MRSTPWDPLADLPAAQRTTLAAYGRALADLNSRLNLVSPASAADLETRHLRHSLALSHRAFPTGSTVVDFGSGGGLPAIPLAIRFPDVRFVAVDAIAKKAEAIRLFARRLELRNVDVWCGRADEWPGAAEYAISRATAPLADLWAWFERASTGPGPTGHGEWERGLVCLKGGDLNAELRELERRSAGVTVERIALGPLLGGPHFSGKEIVAVHRRQDATAEA